MLLTNEVSAWGGRGCSSWEGAYELSDARRGAGDESATSDPQSDQWQLQWWQAAEILGISPRSMRRWKQRYERHGYDGLFDRRRRRPSPRKVPLATARPVLRLYREQAVSRLQRSAFHRSVARALWHHPELSVDQDRTANDGAGGCPTVLHLLNASPPIRRATKSSCFRRALKRTTRFSRCGRMKSSHSLFKVAKGAECPRADGAMHRPRAARQRPSLVSIKQFKWNCQFAQSLHSNSACERTVAVAFSCLSGG